VLDGTRLETFGLPIASDVYSVGTVLVSGAGSTIAVSSGSELRIGAIGRGSLTMENAGSVTVGTGKIILGYEYVAEGTFTIGNGTRVGAVTADEISTREGKGTLVFNHTNESLVIGSKLLFARFAETPDSFFAIRHEGPGTTVLTSTQSAFAGSVTVSGGTLLVNGSIMGSTGDVGAPMDFGTYTVAAGGTLGGKGLIQGTTTVAGTLAPGDGLGLISFDGNLSFTSAATLAIQLGGKARGTGHDAVNVSGLLTYGGKLRLTLADGFAPAIGDTFDLFNGYNSFLGTFGSIEFDTAGYAGSFSPQTGILTMLAVPEPATAVLLLYGLSATACRRRRRSGASA
jgi:T5SS/PEP-CTERM-associated repeat protein/autotransporter-associated beta strand protein